MRKQLKTTKTSVAVERRKLNGDRKRNGNQVGLQTRIKEIMAKDPTITTDGLVQRLEHQGYVPSRATVAAIRWTFMDSMRVLKRAGKLTSNAAQQLKA